MITKEILKANAVLSALTDEQISAIVTISQNDENTVIGQRIGEVYRQLDETIAKSTGVQRNGDEKTYLYLERASKILADSKNDLAKQIDTLTKDKDKLTKAIAEGADEETKKALSQAKKDLLSVTKQYSDLKEQFDAQAEKHTAELNNVKIENALTSATANIAFKKEFPQSVTQLALTQALNNVKAMHPELIDDGKGGKTIAFKDENGVILRNPENQLNPFSAQELLKKELKNMGVLDEGRKQEGAGTTPPEGSAKGLNSVDVTGAKTRVEAYEAISASLMAQGMTNGSAEFDKAMQQAWKDNNVAALPES